MMKLLIRKYKSYKLIIMYQIILNKHMLPLSVRRLIIFKHNHKKYRPIIRAGMIRLHNYSLIILSLIIKIHLMQVKLKKTLNLNKCKSYKINFPRRTQ
jgi:hypothetical protein